MSHRRIILGTLLGVAAVVSIPSAANAATCDYDSSARTMDVRYRAGEQAVTVANSNTLQYSDGASMWSCYDLDTSKPATGGTVNKLTIRAASGTGAQAQKTTIDETHGEFTESNPNLQMYVFTGTNDHLVLNKGGGDNRVQVAEQSGLALGPEVDLNYDGRPDLRMTTSSSLVEVRAGSGRDLIDATRARTFPTWQYGGPGNDTLFGSQSPGDLLEGEGEADSLYSFDDNLGDVVRGGSGADKGMFDYPVDSVSGVETVAYG
jgi:hypothetical protein